ncbi:hypothetical protein ACI6Q2_22560 [Chitinophagaceae bacterium LWZ2-11]
MKKIILTAQLIALTALVPAVMVAYLGQNNSVEQQKNGKEEITKVTRLIPSNANFGLIISRV